MTPVRDGAPSIVVGVMVWVFLVEPRTMLLGHISKFTIGQTATSIGGGTGGDVLPWAAAFLVLLGWTAAFLVAAALVDRRRDVV